MADTGIISRIWNPAAPAPAPAVGAPVAAPAPAAAPPQSPSSFDRLTMRLRRGLDRGIDQVFATLEAREPWERYRPRSTALPPTFPSREDRPVTGAPSALAGMAYTTRYDIHYDGDFLLEGRPDMAIRFNDVMARQDWPSVIRNQLSSGVPQAGDPIRVMVPGLNTANAETVRRIPAVSRDTNLSYATLDNASSDGLADITLTLPGGKEIRIPTRHREWLAAVFQRSGMSFQPRAELQDDVPRDAQGRVEVPPGSGQWLAPSELRGLASALNELSDPNKVLIDNTQRLIMAHIDRPDAPPLELWGYSEGSIVLGKAFEDIEARYLAERMRDCPPQQREQRLAALRQRFRTGLDRITVLGIGAGYGELGAPVRRVDFYADHGQDLVARFAGSRRMTPSYRWINDLVNPPAMRDTFIAYQQPFGGFDAHNLFAGGGSVLGLYMELNNTRTVRGLYDADQAGRLVHPTMDQVVARIRRQGGESELWDKTQHLPPAN